MKQIKKKMKVAVTGADGFIGKKLCEALEAKQYEVVRYDADNLDIRGRVAIPDTIDVIYHLAAINRPYLSLKSPFETFQVNVLGTLNLLEAVKNSQVKKIIFASSILVYNDIKKTKETDLVGYNGMYPYGFEKLIGEEYIKIYSNLYGFDYTILRISGVYGPGMYKNPIFDVLTGFIKGTIKLYINKNSVYNFVYIDDVVGAMVMALDWKNEAVNVYSDENVKIIDICRFLKKQYKKSFKIEDAVRRVNFTGNNAKIKKKGWKIKYPLKKGLIETYNFLNHGHS